MASVPTTPKHVLLVLTSHDKLGEHDEQTGWYLPEVVHPYDEFKAAGINMTFASIKGGAAPVDEGSVEASAGDASCVAFLATPETKALVDNTVKLSEITDLSAYDGMYIFNFPPYFLHVFI